MASPAFQRGMDDVLRELNPFGPSTPPRPQPATPAPYIAPTPPPGFASGMTSDPTAAAQQAQLAGIQARKDEIHNSAVLSARLADATGGSGPANQQLSPYELRQRVRTELARVYPETPTAAMTDQQLLALTALAAQQNWQYQQPPPVNRQATQTVTGTPNQPQPGTQQAAGSSQPSESQGYQGLPPEKIRFLEQNLGPEQGQYPELEELRLMQTLGQKLPDGTPVTDELIQEAARIALLPEDAPERQEIAAYQAEQDALYSGSPERQVTYYQNQNLIAQAAIDNIWKQSKEEDRPLTEEEQTRIGELREQISRNSSAARETMTGATTSKLGVVGEKTAFIEPYIDFNTLDLLRQAVISAAGDNAYDVSNGDKPRHTLIDWSPWGNGLNLTGYNEWYKNPKNWPFIRDAYENGFTGSNGMKFTGGRAVWELYAALEMPTWYERGLTDMYYDPMNVPMVLAGVGKGAEALGVVAARTLPEAAGAPIARGLATTGRVLALPQEGLNLMPDQLAMDALGGQVANTLFPKGIGAVGGRINAGRGYVRGLFSGADQMTTGETLLTKGIADAEGALTEVQKASAQGPIPLGDLTPGGGPEGGGVIPEAPATMDELAAAVFEAPSKATVRDIVKTIGIPKGMAWTIRGAGKQYAGDMLAALRMFPERAAEVGSAWKQLADMHIAMNSGSARLVDADHVFSHVDFVVSLRKLWREQFPELAFPSYAMREKPHGVKDVIGRMVFGTPEESRAAFKEFAQHTSMQGMRKDTDRSVWKYANGERIPYGEIRNRAMAARIEWERLLETNRGLPAARESVRELSPLAALPEVTAPETPAAPVSTAEAPSVEAAAPTIPEPPAVPDTEPIPGPSRPEGAAAGLADALPVAPVEAPDLIQASLEQAAPEEAIVNRGLTMEPPASLIPSNSTGLEPSPAPVAPSAPVAGLQPDANVGTVRLDQLQVDPDSFQMRQGEFSQSSVDMIKGNFDPQRLGRIEVRDNGDGSFTVLSGHSRFQALQEMLAEGRLPEDFPVPVEIKRGTEADLQLQALTSNDRTNLMPAEEGQKIRRLMEGHGQSLDQARGATSRPQAQRLVDLTYLSQNMQQWVNQYPKFIDSMSKMGELVRKGKSDTAEMDRFFETQVAPGSFTDTEIKEQLRIWEQLADEGPTSQLGMFAGMDLGSDSFARANQVIVELQRERAQLVRLRNQLLGLDAVSSVRPELQLSDVQRGMIAQIDQEITAIEDKLNGKVRDWFAPAASSTPPEAEVAPGMTTNLFGEEVRIPVAPEPPMQATAFGGDMQPEPTPVELRQQQVDAGQTEMFGAPAAPAKVADDPVQELEVALQDAIDERDDLKTALDDARSERDEAPRDEREDYRESVADAKREHDEAVANVKRIQGELDAAKKKQPTKLFAEPSNEAVGIVPNGPAQARRGAQQANTAAIEARIASEQALPGAPVILSDRAREVLGRVFTQGDLAGVSWADRLQDLMGRRLEDASYEEIADAMLIFRHDLQMEYGIRESNWWGQQLDAANRGFSALTLMPFWSIPRQVIGNTILGNTVQQGLAGHWRALGMGLHPENIKEFLQLARKGELPVDSPAYQFWDELGRGPNPLEFRGYATAAVGGGKRNTTTKLAQGAKPGLLGAVRNVRDPILNAANWATGIRFGRELVNGFEWSFRVGAGAEHARNYLGKHFGAFVDGAVETGGRLASVIPEADLRILLNGPGWRTNPQAMFDRVSRLATSYGMDERAARGFAERVSRDFANTITQAEDYSLKLVDKSLFNFETKNIDVYLRRMIPFHMYLTRAYPFYAEQMIRHPGVAAAYYRAHEGLDRYAEENNWPDSMKGFVQIMSGPLGLALFAKPLIAGGLLDIFIDVNGGYEPEHLSRIGKALGDLQKFGFSPLPWWGAILNMTGYLGDSPIGLDPTGTFGSRKTFGSVVQSLAAHGVLGDDWERYLGKPYEQRLADLRSHLSGFLPGSSNIPETNQGAAGAQIIRNLMLTAALEDKGLTQAEFDQLAMQPEGSAGRDQHDGILEEVLGQWEAQDGNYFDSALESYADFDAIQGNIARSTITGPKTIRSMDQIARGNAAYHDEGEAPPAGFSWWPQDDPLRGNDAVISSNEARFLQEWEKVYGEPYAAGDLERMEASWQNSRDVSQLTTDAAPVVIADRERDTMGDPDDRDLLNMWNEIAFGDMQPGVGDNQIYQIGGQTYWYWQLANASQEDRFALADQWVADRDPDGSVQKLRDDRDIFDASHPEYALFEGWKKDVRSSWEQYGANALRMYRAQVSKDNPNAARYFNEETRRIRERLGPSATVREINKELDKLTLSLDAYMAIKGIQRKIGDPKALEHTIDPRASGDAGPESGARSPETSDWPTRVQDAIREAEAQQQQANQILSQAAGQSVDLASIPDDPIFQTWIDSMLGNAGFAWGADHWIYEDYQKWARDQLRIGLAPTVAGYIQYTRTQKQADAPPPRPQDLYYPSAAD